MSARLTRPADRRLGPLARATIEFERLDRRRLMLLGLAVVGIALAARGVQRSRTIVAELGPRTPVAVAARPLAAGDVLGPDDVEWRQWPAGLVPPASRELVTEGATLRSAIGEGEPILDSALAAGPTGLAPGEVGVTLPLPLAPPPVEPGAVVELLGIRPVAGLDDLVAVEVVPLGPARVLGQDETGLTVAVDDAAAARVVETIAIGSVEVVVTPFRS